MKTFVMLLLFTSMAAAGKALPNRLGTNHNFDDHTVRGKFQTSGEAITAVEDEKGLSDLLQVRRHFKDRLEQSANRR